MVGQPILAVANGPFGPTNRDENRRIYSDGDISGRGRGCSGEVEADWLSDPEQAFEQMSVRRYSRFLGWLVVRDRA
jgi:hypothetical protein